MSETEALKKPTKDQYNLVRIAYDATVLRYTDWTMDVANSTPNLGGVFESMPSLSITLPKKSGTLVEEDCKIILPLNEFSERISNGEPFADTRIWCMEYVKSPTTPGLTLVHFVGDIFVATRNFEGRPDRVQLIGKSWKAQLAQRMGVPIVSMCDNTFGDARCGIDVEALAETGTLTGAEGKKAVITGLSAQDDRYWHRGYIEKDGVRILIRDWLSGEFFELSKTPPADWIGTTITVKPGCNKLIATCRGTWNNEPNFNGAGLKVAARNPVFEAR